MYLEILSPDVIQVLHLVSSILTGNSSDNEKGPIRRALQGPVGKLAKDALMFPCPSHDDRIIDAFLDGAPEMTVIDLMYKMWKNCSLHQKSKETVDRPLQCCD